LCWFNEPCTSDNLKVDRKSAVIAFYLGKGSEKNVNGIPYSIAIEDYWVPGSRIGDTDDKCYLPIFQADSKNDNDTADLWFLGNMFMDSHYITHEIDSSNEEKPLKIGLMPKKDGGSEGPGAGTDQPVKPAGPDTGGGAGGALLAIFLTALVIALGSIGYCFYKKKQQRSGFAAGSSLPDV